MTRPTRLGTKGYSSASFASTLSSSGDAINFGSGSGRYCVVHAMSVGASSATTLDTCTIGGVSMTGDSDRSMQTDMGIAGRHRIFVLDAGSVPSGTNEVLLTASTGDARLQMIVEWGDGESAIGTRTYAQSSSASPTWTQDSDADSICSVLQFNDAQTVGGGNTWTAPYVTVSGASGSTLGVQVYPNAGEYGGYAVHEDGATSTTLGASYADNQYTPTNWGWRYSVTGVSSQSNAPRAMLLGIG